MLRSKKPLPEFFNPELIKKYSDLVETEEKDFLNELRSTKRHTDAKNLFNVMCSDEVLDLENSAKNIVSFQEDAWEKKYYRRLIGQILYDYYRRNNVEDKSVKGTDVFIPKAKDILKEIHEETIKRIYEQWKILIDSISLYEVSDKGKNTSKNTLRFNKNSSKVYLNGEKDKENPLPKEKLISRITSHFEKLLTSHLSFIKVEDKFKMLNNMFNDVRKCNTIKEIKASILIHFYDLVYAISIVSNWYSYDTAKKIITIQK